MIQIQKTIRYEIFNLNKYNRMINQNHVEKLVKKISERDKSELNPIIVNSDMEIVDGQHRFKALKNLNKPIYYIVDNDFKKEDLIELNTNQKNWTNDDYLNFYIRNGNLWYKEFKEFKERFNLKFSNAIKLFVADSNESSCNGHVAFKSGNIKIKNLKRAYFIANIINQLELTYLTVNTPTINALCYLYDFHNNNIKWDELIKKTYKKKELNNNKLIGRATTKDALLQLDEIYNMSKRKPYKFYAQFELSKNKQ